MRSTTLLLAALLVAPATTRAQRDPCAGVSGRMTSTYGSYTTIVIADAARCLEVRATGRATIADDDRDVKALTANTTFVATERRGGTTRALTLVERDGRIERMYTVDGANRPVAESVEWFGGVVLDLVRDAGYDAEARVGRLRARGGAGAVLDEIPQLRSSHVRSVYFQRLLSGGGLTDAELRRVVQSAATIESDHDRSVVLQALLERTTVESLDRAAFVRAVDDIDSDHERRLVLVAAASGDRLGGDWVRALTTSAARLDSDHEKATVLLAIATPIERLHDPAAHAAFDAAMRTLNSDSEYRRVASVVVR